MSLCLGWQYFSRSLDASLCSPTVWLSRALTSAPQVAGRVTFFSQCLSTSRRQVESFPCFSMLSRVPTGTRSFSPTSYHLERHSWISSLTSTRSSNVSISEGKMKGGHRHWRIFNLSWLLLVMKELSHSVQCMYSVQMESLNLFVCGWFLSISYHSVLVANTIAIRSVTHNKRGCGPEGCWGSKVGTAQHITIPFPTMRHFIVLFHCIAFFVLNFFTFNLMLAFFLSTVKVLIHS